MKTSLKSFIETQLIKDGIKPLFIKMYLNDAICNYKLMLINPPKRVNITDSLSFIIENKRVIFFDSCCDIATFNI